MNRIRTFIFEDDYLTRVAIKTILKTLPEIEVVGEEFLPQEALEQCKRKSVQLILVDAEINRDKTIGPEFVRMVRAEMKDVRILGLTRYPECLEALKQAGCDFVATKELIESETDARRYIREALSPRPIFRDLPPPVLTENQNRVLLYICDGLTEQEIIQQLGVASRKPVRKIKDELFNIFGANSMPNLVDLAYRRGYLNPKRD